MSTGLITMEEKVEAVLALKFPENLQEIEYGLGFFGFAANLSIISPVSVALRRSLKQLGLAG